MSLLITGGGLIGAHVAALASTAGHQVVLYDRAPDLAYIESIVPAVVKVVKGDILDPIRLTRTLEVASVKGVIHTAGLMTAALRQNPIRGIQVNTTGTAAVAEAVVRARVPRMLFCSSLTVYGEKPAGFCHSEDHPTDPTTLYGASKLAAEELLRAYTQTSRLWCVIVRLAGVFGLCHGGHGGWIARKLQQVLTRAPAGGDFMLPEILSSAHEYLYVKDAAAAILRALTMGASGRVYNIGTGSLVSGTRLMGALSALFPNTRFSLPEVDRTPGICMDIHRARTELRFEPAYSLEEAFQQCITSGAKAR